MGSNVPFPQGWEKVGRPAHLLAASRIILRDDPGQGISRGVGRSRDAVADPERRPPAPMEATGPDPDNDPLEPFVDIPRTPLKSPPAAPAFRRPPDPGE